MITYDEFNHIIRDEVKALHPEEDFNEEQLMIIYQSNALNVKKGVAFDGEKFYIVTYDAGKVTTDVYEKQA